MATTAIAASWIGDVARVEDDGGYSHPRDRRQISQQPLKPVQVSKQSSSLHGVGREYALICHSEASTERCRIPWHPLEAKLQK